MRKHVADIGKQKSAKALFRVGFNSARFQHDAPSPVRYVIARYLGNSEQAFPIVSNTVRCVVWQEWLTALYGPCVLGNKARGLSRQLAKLWRLAEAKPGTFFTGLATPHGDRDATIRKRPRQLANLRNGSRAMRREQARLVTWPPAR
jgi:hypothetical protein